MTTDPAVSGMRSKGFPFTLGVWRLRLRLKPPATVRKSPREGCMAVCKLLQEGKMGQVLEVSQVTLLPFAWQASHLVTFRCVLYIV